MINVWRFVEGCNKKTSIVVEAYIYIRYTLYMKRFLVCLGLLQYDQLKAQAKKMGLSMGEVVRRALDLYLQRRKW